MRVQLTGNFIICTFHKMLLNDQSRKVRWKEHVVRGGKMRIAYATLVVKVDWKTPLEKLAR
jgi:hypothetical protein